MDVVHGLEGVTTAGPAAAGTLAVELGGLIRAGMPVPPGFVITAGGHDGELRADLLAAYHRLGDAVPVVVRRSAEGSCAAAALGVTGGAVAGDAAVLDRVLACRTSWPRPDAVVVQQAVPSERSGMAYISGPRVLLRAGYGLSSAMLSGAVQPDSYLLITKGPRLVGMWLGHQTHKVVLLPDGTECPRVLTPAEADSRVLSDSDAIELADLAVAVQRYYRAPWELEWAMAGGTTWLLRSTALRSWPSTGAMAPSRLYDVVIGGLAEPAVSEAAAPSYEPAIVAATAAALPRRTRRRQVSRPS